MSERMKETREMLARHHRDGERFAQMMKESFERRFDEAFWADWEQWVVPAYSERPVILDLGAGPGMFVKAAAERYPAARVVGVECAPYMLDAAETLPDNGELLCQDLHDPHFPLEEASVDAAVASVVLHEMNQPVRALQELTRCLRPGGRLLILDWVRAPLEVYVRNQTDEGRLFDPETPVDELEDLFVHFVEHNRFSREDLYYLLHRTGFAVIDSTVTREGRYGRLIAQRR
ncbi:class I SAM-dependent methyltransferase [Thiohalomonas denitrificans]|uniref:Methyltransferase domain-containing protein n=1 Tax=Thiohalomonas denitrificans TaxID=415747 RepID=A0A1G5PSN4_9GAMM|nr:class I SAM-dependent methyltransferase [Thiohalomonas denitrificans]SCZ52564.1 Methyltransferase domain-containing protein [Thiohalomonas denitrificans]